MRLHRTNIRSLFSSFAVRSLSKNVFDDFIGVGESQSIVASHLATAYMGVFHRSIFLWFQLVEFFLVHFV